MFVYVCGIIVYFNKLKQQQQKQKKPFTFE